MKIRTNARSKSANLVTMVLSLLVITVGTGTIYNNQAEGKRIQYNFVKPHMALKGETPAKKTGLDVKGWNNLLRLAVATKENLT